MTFAPLTLGQFLTPLLHGQIGALDEIAFFCLPIVIAIVVLAVTSARSRKKQERVRTRAEGRKDTEKNT